MANTSTTQDRIQLNFSGRILSFCIEVQPGRRVLKSVDDVIQMLLRLECTSAHLAKLQYHAGTCRRANTSLVFSLLLNWQPVQLILDVRSYVIKLAFFLNKSGSGVHYRPDMNCTSTIPLHNYVRFENRFVDYTFSQQFSTSTSE